MQFRDGANVYTASGTHVGSINRVVIDPGSNQVTHVVIRQGVLFTEDKVVPIEMVDSTTEQEVRLRTEADDLDELPDFEERYYIPPTEGVAGESPEGVAQPYYWYPPVGTVWGGSDYPGAYGGYLTAPYLTHTEQNIPEGSVGLKEGAAVSSADGKKVGNVERIFTDAQTTRATHLLIEEGWLFTTKKLIPINWVHSVTEDEIVLSVAANKLEQLPEYEDENLSEVIR